MDWNYRIEHETNIEALVGKTVTQIEGGRKGDERLLLRCTDGSSFLFFHAQDCCECVRLEEVHGDLDDLIGYPILQATEQTNSEDDKPDEFSESWTWTFYRLSTIKGTVTLRWLGESNGYYSEAVEVLRDEDGDRLASA